MLKLIFVTIDYIGMRSSFSIPNIITIVDGYVVSDSFSSDILKQTQVIHVKRKIESLFFFLFSYQTAAVTATYFKSQELV